MLVSAALGALIRLSLMKQRKPVTSQKYEFFWGSGWNSIALRKGERKLEGARRVIGKANVQMN